MGTTQIFIFSFITMKVYFIAALLLISSAYATSSDDLASQVAVKGEEFGQCMAKKGQEALWAQSKDGLSGLFKRRLVFSPFNLGLVKPRGSRRLLKSRRTASFNLGLVKPRGSRRLLKSRMQLDAAHTFWQDLMMPVKQTIDNAIPQLQAI